MQGVVLSLPLPPGSPSPAGAVRAPAQWSLKPGMGKARAKVSTRWRRLAKRCCVSASCSKKVLNSWSLPGDRGGDGEKGRGTLLQAHPCPGRGGGWHQLGAQSRNAEGEVPAGTQEGGRWGPLLTGFALDIQGQRNALVDEGHNFLEIVLMEVAGGQCGGTWGTEPIRAGSCSGAPSAETSPTKVLPKSWPPCALMPRSESETGCKLPRGVLKEG